MEQQHDGYAIIITNGPMQYVGRISGPASSVTFEDPTSGEQRPAENDAEAVQAITQSVEDCIRNGDPIPIPCESDEQTILVAAGPGTAVQVMTWALLEKQKADAKLRAQLSGQAMPQG